MRHLGASSISRSLRRYSATKWVSVGSVEIGDEAPAASPSRALATPKIAVTQAGRSSKASGCAQQLVGKPRHPVTYLSAPRREGEKLKRFIYHHKMGQIALAVDVGGTKVEAALVDESGAVLPGSRFRRETGRLAPTSTLVGAIRIVAQEAQASYPTAQLIGAGIGSAGPVSADFRQVYPINLPALRGTDLVDLLTAATGIPATLRLDGSCIALAEGWLGAARGVSNALVLVVSTGVGGGLISNGALLAGGTGNAGHLGQMVIYPDDPDSDGTVEAAASGPNAVAWARGNGWTGANGEDLAASYVSAHPRAIAAVEKSTRAVGLAIANASTLLDLEVAVIGGGFAKVAADYTSRVQKAVETFAVVDYAKRVEVRSAELGDDAPLVGAAALVFHPERLATKAL